MTDPYTILQIDVSGPTGSGKTAVLAAIEKMLQREFGMSCASPALDEARRAGDPDNPAMWEKPAPRSCVAILNENNHPR
jgi:predicted ATP-binding protein involved in virulence